jgi:SecD/SecF fusion protein
MQTPRWVMICYAIIIFAGILAALPNLLTAQQLASMPDWVPKQQVTLGLDLRGGAHLVLEVDEAELKTARLQSLAEEARGTLRKERVENPSIRVAEGAVVVSILDRAQRARAVELLWGLGNRVGGVGSSSDQSDIEVSESEGQIRLSITDAGWADRVDSALEQSLEIVRQRIDQVGVAEPTIQRVGPDRLLVQLPGLQDPARLRELLGSTAKMTFHMVANLPGGQQPPPGFSLLPDVTTGIGYVIEDRIALDGERLTDARSGFDPITNRPIVTFKFDSLGSRQFAEITRENVGRPFAIVLDGKVLSAPVIEQPIVGGSGRISGNFTVEETAVLSALLRAGALPAPLTVIEERTVGPDLGSDVISMGLFTGLVGFGLVVALMLVLYRGWGLIANFALALNVILTIGVLSFIGATLTLPGIAGIILGIGLAVDANILINERIREEVRKGASAFAALDHGFKRAYSTIVDANVTSLIVTALLFMFGSGAVRGFAVTMMLGIAISMFTAVAIVRILMIEIVRRGRLKTLHIEPLFRLAPEGTKFAFMKARFVGIGVSILLSVASIALFVKPGLNYGIDFVGGIQVEVETSRPADLAQLRERIGSLGLGEVSLQDIGNDSNVLIRVERQDGGEEAQTAAIEALRTEIAEMDPGASIERSEVVGPKVSGELAQSGVLAVVLASLAMLAYIWWRFEWNFAIGAIATLVLDTTKTIGFFAITGLDFSLTAIAALLTIIGYSVNDKVVVYDRMRENLRLHRKMPLREIVDLSINQVLSRCIYTSLTTFLCLLPMALWGGAAVESFAVPMLFGIVIATSSSIFISAPILLLLGNWWQRREHRISEETLSRKDAQIPREAGT